jgi:CheY-like chemotaxis protein
MQSLLFLVTTVPKEKITHIQKRQPEVGEKPLVLIIETEEYTRQLMAFFLEEAGYTVNFADDGYTALDRIRLNQPALLITDILLPHLDGLSLCRLLKKDPVTSGVPILVYTFLNEELRARESGADAFMKKPFEKNKLLEIVNSFRQSKSAQENA